MPPTAHAPSSAPPPETLPPAIHHTLPARPHSTNSMQQSLGTSQNPIPLDFDSHSEVSDSESALSPARSDISDASPGKSSDISGSSDCKPLLPRLAPISFEPPPNATRAPRNVSRAAAAWSALEKEKEKSRSKANGKDQKQPAQWPSSTRHRIPAPLQSSSSASSPAVGPVAESGRILVHLTFQQHSRGTLFHPADAALSEADRLILSHSLTLVRDKGKSRTARPLGRMDRVTGFSTRLPQSTTESQFERYVHQLLRCYFLHPAPEGFLFQIEFRVVNHGNRDKEGLMKTFGGDVVCLGDLHTGRGGAGNEDTRALSAVVTKIFVDQGVGAGLCSDDGDSEGIRDCVWTHWVRVGNENEFVDRFPTSRLFYTSDGRDGSLPRPYRKDRAVLFGVGLG